MGTYSRNQGPTLLARSPAYVYLALLDSLGPLAHEIVPSMLGWTLLHQVTIKITPTDNAHRLLSQVTPGYVTLTVKADGDNNFCLMWPPVGAWVSQLCPHLNSHYAKDQRQYQPSLRLHEVEPERTASLELFFGKPRVALGRGVKRHGCPGGQTRTLLFRRDVSGKQNAIGSNEQKERWKETGASSCWHQLAHSLVSRLPIQNIHSLKHPQFFSEQWEWTYFSTQQ